LFLRQSFFPAQKHESPQKEKKATPQNVLVQVNKKKPVRIIKMEPTFNIINCQLRTRIS